MRPESALNGPIEAIEPTCRRRSGQSARRSNSVPATRLSIQPDVECFSGGAEVRVKIEATTTQGADPSPFSHQTRVAEQRGLDREHVESRHVAAWIPSLEHQHLEVGSGDVGRMRHGAIVAKEQRAVQRIV